VTQKGLFPPQYNRDRARNRKSLGKRKKKTSRGNTEPRWARGGGRECEATVKKILRQATRGSNARGGGEACAEGGGGSTGLEMN